MSSSCNHIVAKLIGLRHWYCLEYHFYFGVAKVLVLTCIAQKLSSSCNHVLAELIGLGYSRQLLMCSVVGAVCELDTLLSIRKQDLVNRLLPPSPSHRKAQLNSSKHRRFETLANEPYSSLGYLYTLMCHRSFHILFSEFCTPSKFSESNHISGLSINQYAEKQKRKTWQKQMNCIIAIIIIVTFQLF